MSHNLGLPKLHKSGGSRMFFATFFTDSKLPSRTTEIETSQKVNQKKSKKITQKTKLILSTAKIKVNLHEIVYVHTENEFKKKL